MLFYTFTTIRVRGFFKIISVLPNQPHAVFQTVCSDYLERLNDHTNHMESFTLADLIWSAFQTPNLMYKKE